MLTQRLIMRAWRPEDREPFAALNADPEVMRHFPAPLSRQESDALVDRMEAKLAADGWGLWALETRDRAEFLGFTGLNVPRLEAHFMPAVEVGWRLARGAWGHGYASEAARAALDHGFTTLELPEIVSFTTAANTRSRAVMERIGMTRDPAGDFEHPSLPPGHPIRPHVLYRISRPA
jgi:RimJ/RimL family protein N-acetyltransferase